MGEDRGRDCEFRRRTRPEGFDRRLPPAPRSFVTRDSINARDRCRCDRGRRAGAARRRRAASDPSRAHARCPGRRDAACAPDRISAPRDAPGGGERALAVDEADGSFAPLSEDFARPCSFRNGALRRAAGAAAEDGRGRVRVELGGRPGLLLLLRRLLLRGGVRREHAEAGRARRSQETERAWTDLPEKADCGRSSPWKGRRARRTAPR